MTLLESLILNYMIHKFNRRESGEQYVEITTENILNVYHSKTGEDISEKTARTALNGVKDFFHFAGSGKTRKYWMNTEDVEKIKEYCEKYKMKLSAEIQEDKIDKVVWNSPLLPIEIEQDAEECEQPKDTPQREAERAEFLYDATVRRYCGLYYERTHRKLDAARIIRIMRNRSVPGLKLKEILEQMTESELTEFIV